MEEMVAARPRSRLRPLVASYTGYRIEGAEPGVHHGLPSRHVTVIVTLEGTVDLAAITDPTQPPASFRALAGGLHARPALISHNGYQHGIHLEFTPLGARILLGRPAGELAGTVVDLGALLGPIVGELVERLRSARTWTDRFLELDGMLTPDRHATRRAGTGARVGLATAGGQPRPGRGGRAGPGSRLEPAALRGAFPPGVRPHPRWRAG